MASLEQISDVLECWNMKVTPESKSNIIKAEFYERKTPKGKQVLAIKRETDNKGKLTGWIVGKITNNGNIPVGEPLAEFRPDQYVEAYSHLTERMKEINQKLKQQYTSEQG